MKILRNIWKSEPSSDSFSKLDTIIIEECDKLVNIFPSNNKGIFQNLCKLRVTNCRSIQFIFKISEKDGDLANLQDVHLETLPKLEWVWKLNESQGRTLELKNLQNIRVQDCDSLEKLFPFSVAKCLCSLQHLVMCDCSQLRVIVDEMKTPSVKTPKLNFPELRIIKFSELPRLTTSFYEGAYEFDCPMLNDLSIELCQSLEPFNKKTIDSQRKVVLFDEKVINEVKYMQIESWHAKSPSTLTYLTYLEVVNCERLENLVSPSTAKNLVHLKNMKIIKCESLRVIVREEENASKDDIRFEQLKALELVSLKKLGSFCGSDSCNFAFPSLEKLVKYFEGMEQINLSEHPTLRERWQHGIFGNDWFCSLKILKLGELHDQCAIPSKTLHWFKSLKELEVQGNEGSCEQVQVIFAMNVKKGEGTTFQLQKLTLRGLPNLMHVWERNDEGIHSFQNLQVVSIRDCENLETVFPVDLAKNFKKLDTLEIESCHRLQQIVGNEEDQAVEFEFLCLTTLNLFDLPNLQYFHTESFTLECPALNTLSVLDCPMLKPFENDNTESRFFGIKDISNLEKLSMDRKYIWALNSWLEQLTGNTYLEYLDGIRLFYDVDVIDKPILPIEILKNAINLKIMSIELCHCKDAQHFEEVFLHQILEVDENKILKHLKILALNDVWQLQSMGTKDSTWLNMICKRLHVLYVNSCPHLTKLEDSTSGSFSSLKELYIYECPILEYLFTSSAAKELMHLEYLGVWDCPLIKEIVAKDQDEPTSGEIELRLCRIYLTSLPSLEYFYSGNLTLKLPSLVQVDMWRCPKMNIFSQTYEDAYPFRGIQASNDLDDELVFYNFLNSSIKKVFKLQLQTLFPVSVVKNLEKLEKLEIRRCDKLQEIIEEKEGTAKNLTEEKFVFPCLKMLDLAGLPLLICFYPQTFTLEFPMLTNLCVLDCHKLELFQTANPMAEGEGGDTSITRQPLFSNVEVISNLKELRLDWKHISALCSMLESEFPEGLKCLNEIFLYLGTDEKEKHILPIHLLLKAPNLIHMAKKLINLEQIIVRECESLKGIVVDGEDEDEDEIKGKGEDKYNNEIIFWKLKLLNLEVLPEFESFYTGSSTLNFPCLNEVRSTKCYITKLFQLGDNFPETMEVYNEGGMNSEIMQIFEEEAA
ncbi:hypothetical protein VNO78_16323 [Psophocarpus tetragonolobus]|uniref:Disease resistance protein At4g27190-like leucine-rich repeats domain-containing protein n=1 Tax=Psophocarpus tetragonolobus TaxID=3891 RepID=A0AAN9XKP6_PSOTE